MHIPKAELHVHIEGTVFPDMARRKAAEHGMTLPDDIFSADGQSYSWNGFVDVVTRVYDAVASTIRTKQDYTDITLDYLRRCAGEGCIYVEMIISPDHGALVGLSYPDMLAGIAAGIDQARAETGIECRLNAALVRHLPFDQVEKTARLIAGNPHPYVVGLDLAGAEQEGDIPKYKRLFEDIERNAGKKLGVRLHAAEAAGAQNGWDALDLNPRRIGHGVRAIEDEKLLDEILRRGIVLEVCPTSNVLAGISPTYKDHPLKYLVDRGVKVTLNSDDPGLFGKTIGHEYDIARTEFGLSDQQLINITKTAVEASFLDAKTKLLLLGKLKRVERNKAIRPPAPK